MMLLCGNGQSNESTTEAIVVVALQSNGHLRIELRKSVKTQWHEAASKTHAHEFKVKKFHDCLFSVRPSWQLVCLDLMNSELTDDFVVKKGRGFPAVLGHCATNMRNIQEQLVTCFFFLLHWALANTFAACSANLPIVGGIT